jgi:leukotriene-A4 hydrolase
LADEYISLAGNSSPAQF